MGPPPAPPSGLPTSPPVMGVASDVPLFNKQKHVSYWLRCLRTPLPTAYTHNDANRMTLAFFLLSALDILGVLFKRTTDAERKAYVDWVYSCQHEDGGFRSFPGCEPDHEHYYKATEAWNPPNMPATYFALSALAVLGDDLSRVRRLACLDWLRRMQDPDGSFGELLVAQGKTHGGKDARYAYFAASIRWYLRGPNVSHGDQDKTSDIDVDKMVRNITASQTYDGGISAGPFLEAHAGLSYCAVATLSLLGRVDPAPQALKGIPDGKYDAFSQDAIVRWLTGRLTTTIDEDDLETIAGAVQDSERPEPVQADDAAIHELEQGFQKVRSMPMTQRNGLPPLLDLIGMGPFIRDGMYPVHWTGFNGRCNKIADTCYAFWCSASLKMLNGLGYVDLPHVQCYLLEKTQHMVVGGFGKLPGDLPDIYHAYLGLAALAIVNGHRDDGATIGPEIEDAQENVDGSDTTGLSVTRKGDTDRTIRELDPALCISRSARLWVESLEWRSTPLFVGSDGPNG